MKLTILICAILAINVFGIDVIVTNTNDSGPGSLRAAIEQINPSPTAGRITFNVPGTGVQVIRPVTALPALTNTVTIDGYTQPGASPNTLAQGDNAVIRMQINTNLVLKGEGSVVRGLSVQGLYLSADGITIQGNFIGVDPTGTTKIPNASGIYLNSTFEHQIGGVHPADRNIISGNSTGIGGFGAPNPVNPPSVTTIIQGNYIGTDKNGTAPLPNTGFGIAINEMLQLIGGTEPGAANIIAFNGQGGINLSARSVSVQIEGNSIFSNNGPGIAGGTDGPIIATATPGMLEISGTFKGVSGQPSRIEIFSNSSCDPSGYGEGAVFLGSARGLADTTGRGTFAATVSRAIVAGEIITATVTPETSEGTTSGFSRCVTAAPPVDLALTISSPAVPVAALSNTTLSLTISNKSNVPATGLLITVELPDNLEFISGTAGWTNNFGELTFAAPVLAGGAILTSAITVHPTLVGSRLISFQLIGNQPDAVLENNHASVTLNVVNSAPRQLVVTNNLASGPGSLSQALSEANDGVGGDIIIFQIPGSGVQTNQATFLIANVPVTIDGNSQPGAKPNTLENGNNAVLLIDLGNASLELAGGDSTVRGLVVPHVFVVGEPEIYGAGNVIEGCFIGTDATGRAAKTNETRGIEIAGAENTRIGGTTPAARNIISGNRSGSAGIETDAPRTIIQGNYIGTDATGGAALGNTGPGVLFTGQPSSTSLVGGTNAGAGNIIAFNTGPGVLMTESGLGRAILGNSIYGNGGIGISYGTARPSVNSAPVSPAGIAAPMITNLSGAGTFTRIQGALNGASRASYRVEFFSSPLNANAFFQSEGKLFLGFTNVTTDNQGKGSFDASFPTVPGIVTATATDSSENTSPFIPYFAPESRCFQPGDLFIGFYSDGAIQWRGAAGQPLSIIFQSGTDTFSDLTFGPDGTLYAANRIKGKIERFDECGRLLTAVNTGTNSPRAIVVDSAGNLYAGLAAESNNIWKFDIAGNLAAQYSVPAVNALGGMDLAPDQHTLFYSVPGNKIARYDLATRQPLPDFVSNLALAGAIRVLPDGRVLASDFKKILLFDPTAKIIWTAPTSDIGLWSGLDLNPDGKTFWAAGSNSKVARFDLATGALVSAFNADIGGNPASLAIFNPGTTVDPQPRLRVNLIGGQAMVAWSIDPAGFGLQTTLALGPNANWQDVQITPKILDGQNTVNVAPAGRSAFYRLIRR